MYFGKDLSQRSETLLDMAMKSCPMTMITAEEIVDMSGVTWAKYDRAMNSLPLPRVTYFTWPQVIQILEELR